MDHSRALSSPGKPGGDGSAGPGTAAEPTEPALGSGWEGRALSEALKHFFFQVENLNLPVVVISLRAPL